MLELFLAGGPFMFGTLVISLLNVAIFVWRLIFFYGKTGASRGLVEAVMSMIESGKVPKALRLTSSAKSPLANILQGALLRANRPEKEIRRAVEVAALQEIPKVKNGTVFLPQLSNLSTLVGLIGTIHGLIVAFQGAGSESVAQRQVALSQGIAIAFYNTFFGLATATAGIIFYLILLNKMNASLAMMEHAASKVVDALLMARDPANKSGAGMGAA
jgi:biopolymer transport protein ExbB/TolQ